MEPVSASALWWAVVGLGAYHGLNPGMGWPLAVSAALMERRASALPRAILVLSGGVGALVIGCDAALALAFLWSATVSPGGI